MGTDRRTRNSTGMVSSSVHAYRFDSSDESPRNPAALCAQLRQAGTIRVAIAHGGQLVRAGLRLLLEREAGIFVVDEASDGDEAVAMVQRLRPDVVLIDVHL